jgi:hypothetical protein
MSVVDKSADNRASKQRRRPFGRGQSGNPNGRPKALRDRVTQAVEARHLGAKAVEMALNWDTSMLRALLSTLAPTRREHSVKFDLPKIETAGDALKASSARSRSGRGRQYLQRFLEHQREEAAEHVAADGLVGTCGRVALSRAGALAVRNGIFVLRTNTDLGPLAAMLCYKQLWTVDRTFCPPRPYRDRSRSDHRRSSSRSPADAPGRRRGGIGQASPLSEAY